jgi:hypothetical protein
MHKVCAYAACGMPFETRSRQKYCCKKCARLVANQMKHTWKIGNKKQAKEMPEFIETTPKTDRVVVKFSEPKPRLCGGCGNIWMKEVAHEDYCPPCNPKLQKQSVQGYQTGDDDSHLHPQTGV